MKKINTVKSFFIIWNYYIHPFIKYTMKKKPERKNYEFIQKKIFVKNN